jgi:DNA polymerase I-like protein with 3'-5' exonuclease and polymerase domains
MLGTYVGQYSREIVNGKIHSFTNLNRVETFRTSMDSVNWQNQIKRNKEAKKYLRSYVQPSLGNRIIECDHSQLEVRLNCCYSGDKNLIKFIEQGLDMHTLTTQETFLLTPEQMKKEYRDKIKGSFVFASFYGSVYFQIAKDLWEFVCSNELREHLASNGIKTYLQFEEQVKEAERILWEERFPQHAEWRKNMWKFYQKHGYIESYTGFKIYGPMRRNNSFNSNVQGSAAHVLLTGINYLQEQMEKKMPQSRLLFQIHDALVGDVAPEEEDRYDYMVWYFCTQKVREVYPWINVPLVMEKERSEINGVWSEMTSCGKLQFE